MPRKRQPRIRHCELCGLIIGKDRGPAAKTCSPECERDRNNAREKARYHRVKDTEEWQAARSDYLDRIKAREAADPAFASQRRAAHRDAERRHADKIKADPARYAAYLAAKRDAFNARTPEQKAARKYWYGQLSPELKQLFLLDLRQHRAFQRLTERTAHMKWDEKNNHLLGTLPDVEVAKLTGVEKHVVRYQREKHKLPQIYSDESKSSQKKEWTDEEIKMLGTMPDLDLSHLIPHSTAAIRFKRVSLGVPSFKKGKPTINKQTVFVTDEIQNLIAELEPFFIERYRNAGLPIDHLEPWQIIEISLKEAASSAQKEQARKRK